MKFGVLGVPEVEKIYTDPQDSPSLYFRLSPTKRTPSGEVGGQSLHELD
ncbi:MAG TPA: hypothetical protein VMV77_14310 [Bacteroidales bacterium]|nr:hypothetical protein [Bacteroidales bacterium]